MRLINISTLELEESKPDRIPSFAVLSHTWGDEEVSYSEMINPDRTLLTGKHGYQKIVEFCEFVKQENEKRDPDESRPHLRLDYVWVDTCCIDKTSSAELSEAINSMYFWYSISDFCVAYLSDYVHMPEVRGYPPMGDSRWFTRGWTLQELLAPRTVIFVDNSWNAFGTKDSLVSEVSAASGIDEQALITNTWGPDGSISDFNASVATRMSWAATRETTRPEDLAYCLLGLFEVNMPLLYGEGGERAFIRLQEEILKESDDHSIFLWNPSEHRALSSSGSDPVHLGALAVHPREFVDSSGCESFTSPSREPHTVTSRGIKLQLALKPSKNGRWPFAIPQCQNSAMQWYAIPLRRVYTQEGAGAVYSRAPQNFELIEAEIAHNNTVEQEIYLLKRTKVLRGPDFASMPIVQIRVCASQICKKSPTASEHLFYPGLVKVTRCGVMDDVVRNEPSTKSIWDGTATGDGDLMFDESRQVSLFFTSSSTASAAPESFVLGIERNHDLSVVTVTLKGLGSWGYVTPEDERIQWHFDLHEGVKTQDASVRLKLKGGLRHRLLHPDEKEVEIRAAAWTHRLDGILAGQRKCVIHLTCYSVIAVPTTAAPKAPSTPPSAARVRYY